MAQGGRRCLPARFLPVRSNPNSPNRPASLTVRKITTMNSSHGVDLPEKRTKYASAQSEEFDSLLRLGDEVSDGLFERDRKQALGSAPSLPSDVPEDWCFRSAKTTLRVVLGVVLGEEVVSLNPRHFRRRGSLRRLTVNGSTLFSRRFHGPTDRRNNKNRHGLRRPAACFEPKNSPKWLVAWKLSAKVNPSTLAGAI